MNSLRSFGNFEKPGLESFGFFVIPQPKKGELFTLALNM